jgi:hypothetical protein
MQRSAPYGGTIFVLELIPAKSEGNMVRILNEGQKTLVASALRVAHEEYSKHARVLLQKPDCVGIGMLADTADAQAAECLRMAKIIEEAEIVEIR